MKQQENLQDGKGLTRVHIHLCLFLILSEWFFYSKSVEKMGCYMSRPGQAVDLLLCAFVQITSKALENDLQYAIGNVMLPVTSSSMTGLAVGQWWSGEAELHRSCKKTYRDCLVTVCSKTCTWVNCRRSFWGVLAPPVLPCTEEQILVLQLGWCLCFSPCSLSLWPLFSHLLVPSWRSWATCAGTVSCYQ